MMTKTQTAAAIAEETFGDAYSADRYGIQEWRKAADLLAARGLTTSEIAWVLRSKWMRWAADCGGADYGYATAEMLRAFLDNPRNHATRAAIRREMEPIRTKVNENKPENVVKNIHRLFRGR